jgi:putative hydrolase of the HAD superfamily
MGKNLIRRFRLSHASRPWMVLNRRRFQLAAEQPTHATTPLHAVIFDLFHTLVDMRHAPPETSTSHVLGIPQEVWNQKVMEESPHHALGTEADPVESVRKIAHAIDPTIPMERILAAVKSRPVRFRAALLQVSPAVLAVLDRLRALGLKTGLISNAGLDEIAHWPESPLAPLFDTALFSCHEKLMKPDPEIYLRAAWKLDVRPESCLFVGDGGSQEHAGAHAAGMHTVLLLSILNEIYPELAASRTRDTTWVVESLPEFSQLIERLCREGLPRPSPAKTGVNARPAGPPPTPAGASRPPRSGGRECQTRRESTSGRCTRPPAGDPFASAQ